MDKTNETDMKIIEHYEKIQGFAQNEINRTFTVYKFLFWGLVVLLTFGITIGTILIGKSLSDIESKYEIKYQASIENAKQTVRKELDDELIKAKNEINENIKQGFNSENINHIVETNAKLRIDLIADRLIAQQIENKITPLKNDLNVIKTNTNNEIDKIVFDYYELGVYNDSKKSFVGLYNISTDSKNKFKLDAQKVIKTKVSDMDIFFEREYGSFGTKLDLKNITDIDVLYEKYYSDLSLDERFRFLEAYWDKSPNSRNDKLTLLSKIFKNETGLRSAYFIGKIFKSEYNLSCDAYNFEVIQYEIGKKY